VGRRWSEGKEYGMERTTCVTKKGMGIPGQKGEKNLQKSSCDWEVANSGSKEERKIDRTGGGENLRKISRTAKNFGERKGVRSGLVIHKGGGKDSYGGRSGKGRKEKRKTSEGTNEVSGKVQES